jgi:transposase
MARRRIVVTEVREVLYQYHKGMPIKGISRSLGMARNTVREFIRHALSLGLRVGYGTNEEVEEIAQKVLEEHQKPRRKKGETQALLKAHHDQLEAWWKCSHMTAPQLVRLLYETHHIKISERTMRRYAADYLRKEKANKTTVHLETAPGEQAQVDYGYVGLMKDPLSEKMRKAYAFIMTLSYSRYRFVRFVFRQDIKTWIDCHIRAFHFWGGVPMSILLDNLRSGVIKADIYDPIINRAYAELERHYNFVADPTKVRTPRHKGKVERSITIARQQVLAGRDFKNIEEANTFALKWCRHENAHQITRTTGQTPWERFASVEKKFLNPLPEKDYECPVWQSAKVHRDHHIVFEGSFYSIPCSHVNETVWVRAGQRMVEIFFKEKRIKTHIRAAHKGQWITDPKDYPEYARHFLEKGADECLKEAKEIGAAVHDFLAQFLKEPTLTHRRKAQAILRLAKQYGPTRLEAACQRALLFENFHYKCVKGILEQKLDQQKVREEDRYLSPLQLKESSYLRKPDEFSSSIEELCQ